jgi:S-adenosylmethionine:tRNA ribosyltransferase-isomerase
MHAEWTELSAEAAEQINVTRGQGGRIVAVGTTVVRVLETVAAKCRAAGASQLLEPWSGETSLFIRPPYEFLATDALLTNFHFPRTTLLLLVRRSAAPN